MKNILTILTVLALLAAPVMGASGTDAAAAIGKAKSDIAILAENGISTFAVNDLLKEAELQFDRGNYDRAAEVAKEISALKESAIRADTLMDEVEARIKELEKEGADTTAVKKSFVAANEAFLRDDFGTAEALATDATDKAEEEQAKLTLEKTLTAAQGFDARTFAAEHWPWILAAIIILPAAGRYGWKRYARKSAAAKLEGLKKKKTAIFNLMKEVQQKHFVEGTVSRNEYLINMRNYRDQLAETNKRIRMMGANKGERDAEDT